jgi:hypothetical protein
MERKPPPNFGHFLLFGLGCTIACWIALGIVEFVRHLLDS